jgi:hypothetical protein
VCVEGDGGGGAGAEVTGTFGLYRHSATQWSKKAGVRSQDTGLKLAGCRGWGRAVDEESEVRSALASPLILMGARSSTVHGPSPTPTPASQSQV